MHLGWFIYYAHISVRTFLFTALSRSCACNLGPWVFAFVMHSVLRTSLATVVAQDKENVPDSGQTAEMYVWQGGC